MVPREGGPDSVTAPPWATQTPSTPGVHNPPPLAAQWGNLPEDQLRALRDKLVESIVQVVVGALTGGLLPGSAITQLADWSVSLLDNVDIAIGDIDALITGVGGTVITDVTNLLLYLKQLVDGWNAALTGLHLSTPTALVQQIPQSIPALVRDIEGGLSAVGGGLTRGPDGAITFIEDGLTHLVQQADQAVLSLPQIAQQILHTVNTISAGTAPAAAVVQNPGVADVMAVGQVAHTALTGAIEQAGATVANDIVAGAAQLGNVVSGAVSTASGAVTQIEGAANVFAGQVATDTGQLGNAVGGFFTNLFNSWTGAAAPSASANDVAAVAAVASKTIADTHTVNIETINSVLPSFYGGGGAGGLNKSVSMSGTLPTGFSSASTIAAASAVYSTAATTDTQTVSGAWSVTDTHAQYMFLRGNSGLTTYVYAKLQSNTPFTGAGNCEIGCVVSGVRHVFSTFALPGNFISGSAYTLSAVSNAFTLTGPGGLDATYTDAGAVSQVGSSYRYGGFGTDGYARQVDAYNTAGTDTYTIPSWAAAGTKFDRVCIGGGGSSGGSYGGSAGTWAADTLIYNTDFPLTTTTMGVTVGVGGSVIGATTATASSITTTGASTLNGAAGAANGNTGHIDGASAGNELWDNTLYIGGFGGLYNSGNPTGGTAPGGGAAEGYLYSANSGEVWITAIDTTAPGSLGFWAFYDSAVVGPTAAYVATSETTSSATYADLATPTDQVTVNIGSSGLALVFLTATMGAGGSMSFTALGANTIAAADNRCISAAGSLGAPFLVPSLAAGATTFKAKYKSASGSVSFQDRRIAVIPL